MRQDLPQKLLDHPNLTLTYRPNVALIILNTNNKILWCERLDYPGSWQFPQGGIDGNETPEEAMWREGSEELGLLTPQKLLQIEKQLPEPLRYDFTPEIIANFLKQGRISHIGQSQHYFLLRFTGSNTDITLEPPPGEHKEFSNFCWAGPELLSKTSPFKFDVYKAALKGFGLL